MKIALEVSGVMPFLLGVSVGLSATLMWFKMANSSHQRSDTDSSQTAMETANDSDEQKSDKETQKVNCNGHNGVSKESVSSTSERVDQEEEEGKEKIEETQKKVQKLFPLI